MKVKIGETIYDSETEPVMVILSDFDKKNISHMAADATKYASFPDGFGSDDEMRAWMLPPNALAQADAACGVSPGAMGSAAHYEERK